MSSFCVDHVLLGLGLVLRVGCLPSKRLLVKNKLSFVSSYQLVIASGLRMGACIHFLFNVGTTLSKPKPMQVLCMLTVSEFIYI